MALSGERKKKVFTIKQSWVWTGGLLSPVNKVLSVVVNLGIHMIMITCVVCFPPPKHVTLISKRRNFPQMTSTQRIAVSIFRYNVAVSHYKKRDKCVAWWRGLRMCEKFLHEAWDHLWGMVNQQFIFLFTVDHTKCLIIILGNAFRRFLHAPKSKVCCFTFWSQSLKRLESSLCND